MRMLLLLSGTLALLHTWGAPHLKRTLRAAQVKVLTFLNHMLRLAQTNRDLNPVNTSMVKVCQAAHFARPPPGLTAVVKPSCLPALLLT
jgi:hypothetical protein